MVSCRVHNLRSLSLSLLCVRAARPGGGTHGDGEANKKKRIAHAQKAALEEKRKSKQAGPKKKKRKSGEAFTEGEKKKLENRTSSDDSDGGPCWSDYERVPGTKAGEKGSCRPKGSKKKKSKVENISADGDLSNVHKKASEGAEHMEAFGEEEEEEDDDE